MKHTRVCVAVIACCFIFWEGSAQDKNAGFSFKDQPDKKQVEVWYNNKLLTAYCYYDSVMKPVLFPLNTVSGITVTRGWPLAPRPGERVDHPHHIGLWLNYEYVNDLDFWNNSTSISPKRRSHYGTILHQEIVKKQAGKNEAALEATATWVRPDKKVLLDETTSYRFSVSANSFIIDRITTLKARDEEVHFNDIKDGMLGIRVARELELPSDKPEIFVDNKGNKTTVPVINNEGVSGMYLSSEGIRGNEVWGTRGRWVKLTGKMKDQPVSITIIDHPENVGYPTYWHARGYGLFAANPLGQKAFSNGKEELNFALKEGESVTFRYRIIVHSGDELTPEKINRFADDFSKHH